MWLFWVKLDIISNSLSLLEVINGSSRTNQFLFEVSSKHVWYFWLCKFVFFFFFFSSFVKEAPLFPSFPTQLSTLVWGKRSYISKDSSTNVHIRHENRLLKDVRVAGRQNRQVYCCEKCNEKFTWASRSRRQNRVASAGVLPTEYWLSFV